MLGHLLPLALKLKLRNRFLRGDGVTCPLCEQSWLTFLPAGVIPRANAICPSCGSMERTRAFWLYMQAAKDFSLIGKTLLHVAPERSLYERFHRVKDLELIAIDKFEPGYSYPAGTRNMDVTDMEFSDAHFDLIICSHVLEHVPDDHKAMAELFRVLKPGGSGILQVPLDTTRTTTYEDPTIIDPKEREKAFGQFDHVRLYGMDYADRLTAAGFNVERVPFAANFTAAERFRYGLVREDLYVVHKAGRA